MGGLRKYCNVIVYTDHCCIFKAAKKTLCRDHFHFLAFRALIHQRGLRAMFTTYKPVYNL